jgi:hypothetical protein
MVPNDVRDHFFYNRWRRGLRLRFRIGSEAQQQHSIDLLTRPPVDKNCR